MSPALRVSHLLCALLLLRSVGFAADLSVVPFWDGETSEPFTNRFGGGILHQGGTNLQVQKVNTQVFAGQGAYRINTIGTIPVGGFGFFQTQLTPNGPSSAYVHGRDLSRFDMAHFWFRNDSNASFRLKYEIKDYRDSGSHSAFRRITIPAHQPYTKISIPLDLSAPGWTVQGNPDLSRARFISYVVEADQGQPVHGTFYLDEAHFTEPGGTIDIATAPISVLAERLARRSFEGLWGTRNRNNGLIPLSSTSGTVGALNSTSAVLKMLPGAVQRGWVTQSTADQYVSTLVGTLNTMLNNATYLPGRYVDWQTLAPVAPREESSADAAFMALALHQYKRLPGLNPTLAASIDAVQNRFNFAAFSDTVGPTTGFKLAYLPDSSSFTEGTYQGYGGEEWLLALAAHLSAAHPVEIKTHYHAGVARTKTFLTSPDKAHLVHSSTNFRAPFTQYLMQLFVDVSDRGVDNYPNMALASNPAENAAFYQQDVDARLAQLNRALFLQPDAGNDGLGQYQAYSMYNQFGRPDLFMPWSVGYALLGDEATAQAALRHHLQNALVGPLGLSDSAWWATGAARPSRLQAEHDFWNTGLASMALMEYLYRDSQFLTRLPEVTAALDRVFYWTWDGQGDGNWSEMRWNGGLAPPSVRHDAQIVQNVVTVTGAHAARRTRVASGRLHIHGSLQGNVSVLPHGAFSGTGQLVGDLSLGGAYAVTVNDDPLAISGVVHLENGSQLMLGVGYQQARGTSALFQLLSAAAVTGQFENQTGTGPDAHLRDGYFLSQVQYSATAIHIEILAALPGDANGDRVVDGLDFNIWNQFKFQSGTTWTQGDFNGDRVTDGADFNLWNTHKFTTYGFSTSLMVLPEPSDMSLIALTCCPWLVRRVRALWSGPPALPHTSKLERAPSLPVNGSSPSFL